MAVYGSFGVIQGGLLSVPIGSTSVIELSNFKIKTNTGRVTGSGPIINSTATKRINVSFGHGSDNSIYQRAATLVPQFFLQIGVSTIGTCWVYYDEGIDDIAIQVGGTLPGTTIVFGKIEWNTATTISDLVFTYTYRTESYISTVPSPDTPKNLYYDGQPWIAGSKNTPLAALSVINEVLSVQNDYVLGAEYFFTKCLVSKLKAKNLTVLTENFKSYFKDNDNFIVYDTKINDTLNTLSGIVLSNSGNNNQIQNISELFTLKVDVGDTIIIDNNLLLSPVTTTVTNVTDDIITFTADLGVGLVGSNVSITSNNFNIAHIHVFPNLPSVQGQTIYLLINKTTGVPSFSTTYNSSTHFVIASSEVENSETDLENISWVVQETFQGLYKQVKQASDYRRAEVTNGFLFAPRLEQVITPNNIHLHENVLVLEGDIIQIMGQDISLPAAPTTGSRQDFAYLHIKKVLDPWPTYTLDIEVVEGVDFENYVDPFTEPSLITNQHNNPFYFSERGLYEAIDPDNEDEGKSFAIPLFVAHRFNQNVFSPGTNDNGGLNRPDGKEHNKIGLEEIELRAFYSRIHEFSPVNEFVYKLISGNMNTVLQPSNINNSVFSRAPLQIDKLGSTTITPGSNLIGPPDDIRYRWDNTQEEVIAYGLLKEDQDSGPIPYNFSCLSYNSATKTLHIQVPTGASGEIVTDGSGQPKDLELRWVTTGQPVGLLNPNWSVGSPNVAFNVIQTVGDANYIAGGLIAVYFKIRYTDSGSLGATKIPKEYLYASLNTYLPTTLSQSIALADNKSNSPVFVKNMSRTTNINSVNYQDKLYIKYNDSSYKHYTYEYHYYVPGNGNNLNDYQIPDEIIEAGQTYGFVGLVDVKRVSTNQSLSVDKVKWTYNSTSEFLIRINDSYTPQPTEAIVFVFGVAGDADKQMDIDVGSLGVSLRKVNIYQLTGTSTPTATQPNADEGIYRYSNGNIIFGHSSCLINKVMRYVAYVGEDMVPCTLTGIGKTLLALDLSQTNITNYTGANWTLVGGKYVPDNGVSIRIVVNNNYRLQSDHMFLLYKYASLPFKPWKPQSGRFVNDATNTLILDDKTTKIIERGILLLSNDGRANGKASFASPLSERFPYVQNINMIGQNVAPGFLGWNDVMVYQQENKPFVEGIDIEENGDLVLNIVVEQGYGQAIWIAKVKQQNFVRLFVYVVSDGKLIVNNLEQCFICDLDYVTVK